MPRRRRDSAFLRLTPDSGEAGLLERRFIDCRRLRAPADAARALGLKTGEAVVRLRRLLSLRGRPVVYDDIWLPGGPFRGLTAERLAGWNGPLYGLFESAFGVRMIRADEKLRAAAADAESAALFDVEVGMPLLSVERLAYTYDEQPVELRRGLYDTRHHHYRNELG